jgi:hypothetical protein
MSAHNAPPIKETDMENILAARRFSEPADRLGQRHLLRACLLWMTLGCCAVLGVRATLQGVLLISADGSVPAEWFGG